MPRYARLFTIFAFLAFLSQLNAQLTDLPTLNPSGPLPGQSTTSPSSSSTRSSTSTSSRKTTSTTAATTTIAQDATTTSSASYSHLDVPTLAGVGPAALIVPDTSGAPFMQKSNLPEGTVFICVGAALAGLGLTILAWRGLVAWAIQRSVKRAANYQYASETKSAYRSSGYPSIYDSNMSLEHLAAANTAYGGGAGERRREDRSNRQSKTYPKPTEPRDRRTSRKPRDSSGLFFSPTAAGMNNAASSRSSHYLPAGYYASGTSATAGGAAITSIGGPPSAGYGRLDSAHPSPPISPGLPAETRYRERDRERESHADRRSAFGISSIPNTSRSSLNLPPPRVPSAPASGRSSIHLQGGRTPSSYLDNVLETHGSAMGGRDMSDSSNRR